MQMIIQKIGWMVFLLSLSNICLHMTNIKIRKSKSSYREKKNTDTKE